MKRIVFALGVMAALAMAACGGSGGGPAGGGNPPPPPPPPPTPPPPGANVVIDIIDNAFVAPNGDRNDDIEITINSGDTVGFTHNGTAAHTVTFTTRAPGSTGATNSGTMNNGSTHSVTLNTPGTYVLRCDFHPGIMRDVTIIVT
jgi:plastocyanin